jgi:hypothetical protein
MSRNLETPIRCTLDCVCKFIAGLNHLWISPNFYAYLDAIVHIGAGVYRGPIQIMSRVVNTFGQIGACGNAAQYSKSNRG